VGLGFVVSKGILHGNAAIQICHTNGIMLDHFRNVLNLVELIDKDMLS
jgi:hypothetical protein